MQFLWKYVDDLMGKGLDTPVVLELLFYATANLVPMALPLAILLSSIMIFGNLAENNELVALKSSGLSLLKVMRPLTFLMILLSIGAFYFSNYTWPKANLQLRVLINDITQKKPDFAIKEGVFYDDIKGYSIRVDEKLDQGKLNGILIIDQSNRYANIRREIRAKSGSIKKTTDGKYLVLDLHRGTIDEEIEKSSLKQAQKPYQQTKFVDARLKLELEGFDLQRTDMSNFQESFEMLSKSQLEVAIDSLKLSIEEMNEFVINKAKKQSFFLRDTNQINYENINTDPDKSIYNLNATEKRNAHRIAASNIRSTKMALNNQDFKDNMAFLDSRLDQHLVAWHRKFTLSVACLMLYFIGAPLGAIIKKGGFGLPVLVAIIFFIFYYMLTISGEKMAKSGALEPYMGMWLSAFVLAPIAFFLTYKASNDSALFNKDTYLRFFRLKRRRR